MVAPEFCEEEPASARCHLRVTSAHGGFLIRSPELIDHFEEEMPLARTRFVSFGETDVTREETESAHARARSTGTSLATRLTRDPPQVSPLLVGLAAIFVLMTARE